MEQELACYAAGEGRSSNRVCINADDFCVRFPPPPPHGADPSPRSIADRRRPSRTDRERAHPRRGRPRHRRPAAERGLAEPVPARVLRRLPPERDRHEADRRAGALQRVLGPRREPVRAHRRRRTHAAPAAVRACGLADEDTHLGELLATVLDCLVGRY